MAARNQSIRAGKLVYSKAQAAERQTCKRLEAMVIVAQNPYAYIDPAVRACHASTQPRHFSVRRGMHTLHEGVCQRGLPSREEER